MSIRRAKNLREFQRMIESDPTLENELKTDPKGTLKKVIDPRRDPKVFKIVLYFVGGTLLVCLIVGALVSLSDPVELLNAEGERYTEVRTINQFFIMIGSAAMGALASLLVPTPD